MATVVVCDGDASMRAAVSTACTDAGLQVVAETDTAADAAELVRRFSVDILVLDLFLADGTGEQTLARLSADESSVRSVIFTPYAPDPAYLRGLGARDVVDNRDFTRLGHVLAHLRDRVERERAVPDRRLASHEVVSPPIPWRSPAGVAPHEVLGASLDTMEIGDSVLAVSVTGLESLEREVGPLLVADCRLAVAGALHGELRVQDLLHEAPTIQGFVALLRGGDERAAAAVWGRLTDEVRAQVLPGRLNAAVGRVDAIGPRDACARALGALQDLTIDTPSFVNV